MLIGLQLIAKKSLNIEASGKLEITYKNKILIENKCYKRQQLLKINTLWKYWNILKIDEIALLKTEGCVIAMPNTNNSFSEKKCLYELQFEIRFIRLSSFHITFVLNIFL